MGLVPLPAPELIRGDLNSHGKIPLPQAEEPAPTAELDNQTHGKSQGETTDISISCRVILP